MARFNIEWKAWSGAPSRKLGGRIPKAVQSFCAVMRPALTVSSKKRSGPTTLNRFLYNWDSSRVHAPLPARMSAKDLSARQDQIYCLK